MSGAIEVPLKPHVHPGTMITRDWRGPLDASRLCLPDAVHLRCSSSQAVALWAGEQSEVHLLYTYVYIYTYIWWTGTQSKVTSASEALNVWAITNTNKLMFRGNKFACYCSALKTLPVCVNIFNKLSNIQLWKVEHMLNTHVPMCIRMHYDAHKYMLIISSLPLLIRTTQSWSLSSLAFVLLSWFLLFV